MRTFRRREVLGAGLGIVGSGVLAGCGNGVGTTPRGNGAPPNGYVLPNGPQVIAAEKARDAGPVRRVRLTATQSTVDLGGPQVRTWTYADRLPGAVIRVTAGDVLEAAVANNLPEPTTVHWHGVAIRNDMDGVPGLTQPPLTAGSDFTYRFALQRPGTYWYHPHTGLQQDRGLYGPLIVEDPREPLGYDREWIVVLDDWVDGVDGSTPDGVMAQLAQETPGAPAGMARRTAPPPGPDRRLINGDSPLLGGHPGDVAYPYYLVNGRVPTAPETFMARPGERIRLRIINAGGDTAFRLALGGHWMTITHADGQPVAHRRTQALLMGMGERYDVLVTAHDGVFPLVALAEGKGGAALAVLRTSPTGAAPGPKDHPAELDGKLLTADRLKADESVAPPARKADTTLNIRMTRDMPHYSWGINDRGYDPSFRYPVTAGQRVELALVNETRMWHPVHLHGHNFALPDGGALKDTTILLPRQSLNVTFDADNPGLWMLHCHNIYHSERGMMTVLGYRV